MKKKGCPMPKQPLAVIVNATIVWTLTGDHNSGDVDERASHPALKAPSRSAVSTELHRKNPS